VGLHHRRGHGRIETADDRTLRSPTRPPPSPMAAGIVSGYVGGIDPTLAASLKAQGRQVHLDRPDHSCAVGGMASGITASWTKIRRTRTCSATSCSRRRN